MGATSPAIASLAPAADRRTADFVASFVDPLIARGAVAVGLPLERAQLDAWRAAVELRDATVLELERRLQASAEVLLAKPPLLVFDDTAATLVAALHQIAFACHGAVDRGSASRRRLAALNADTLRLLASLPAPRTRAQVLLAHLLVAPFFALYRRDVLVSFSLGSRRFFGEDVHWLRMPFRWRVTYEETVGCDVLEASLRRPTAQALLRLLALSPLTRVVEARRLHDRFDFLGLDAIFEDQELCRLAVNDVVDRGLAAALPAFAHAFETLATNGATSRAYALQVARFVVTCALTQELWRPYRDQQAMLAVPYQPPTTALRFETPAVSAEQAARGETDAIARARLVRRGWALVDALLARPELLGLPESDRGSRTFARLVKRLQAVAQALGPDRRELRRLVAAAFGT